MQKFHILGISSTIYFLGLYFAGFWWQIPSIAFWLPATFIGIFITYAAMNLDAQFFIPAICHGKTGKKKIALTFDDGPHPEITPKILDLLKKHQLPATFFLIGKNIYGNENILKRMHNEGHLIGNHSFNHSVKIDFYWHTYVQQEIKRTNEKIEQIIEKKLQFFRPPFGVTNPHISIAVRKEKIKIIGWNVRSFDAGIQDKKLIINRLKKNIQSDGILLFHDIRPICLEVLEEFIPFLKSEGYEVISLEKLINEKAYEG